MQDPAISNILLEPDLRLADASNAGTLPVRLLNRNLTIGGSVSYNATAYWQTGQQGVPVLDFSLIWPVFIVGAGSTLTWHDLILTGIYPFDTTEVQQSQYPRTIAMVLFPTVVVENGGTVVIDRVSYRKRMAMCQPEYFARQFEQLKSLLGDGIELVAPNTTLYLGNRSYPQQLTYASGQDAGTGMVYQTGPITLTCGPLESNASTAAPAAQSSSSGGGLSAGAWVGIAMGIVCAAAIAAALALLLRSRQRRRRRTAGQGLPLALLPGSPDLKRSSELSKAGSGVGSGFGTGGGGSGFGTESPVASLGGMQMRQLESARGSSMMRVRFGDLAGLEIGGLIGRGAFGRVYRGSLRGASVAIKVLEYSVGLEPSSPGTSASANLGLNPASEAMLLTRLAHPHIVSLIRCSVLKVQSPPVHSGSWGSLAAGSPAARQPASPASAPATSPFGEAHAPFTSNPSDAPTQPAEGDTSSGTAAAAASPSAAALATAADKDSAGALDLDFAEGERDSAGGTSSTRSMSAVNLAALRAAQAASARASGAGSSAASPVRISGAARPAGSPLVSGSLAVLASVEGGVSQGPAGRDSSGGVLPSEPGQYEIWLVQEFCERGSLEDAIHRRLLWRPDGSRREALLLGILIDVAQGLCYLHEANVVHGDLKPGNVLLKSAGQGRLTAKIADFGLSKLLPNDRQSLVRTQALGTACYMPPELLSANRLSRATDVYSFALIMLEAWTGSPPFSGRSVAAVFFSVVHKQERPTLPADLAPAYAALIRDGWQQEPEQRPSIHEMLERLRGLQASLAAAGAQAAAIGGGGAAPPRDAALAAC